MKTSKFMFKTILVLTLTLFLFTSCSSDDDNGSDAANNDVENLLPGKWYFDIAGDDEIAECESTSHLQFYENGTAYALIYMLSDGDCIPWMSTEYNYELISENTIQFTVLDNQGQEEPDNFFNAEIISISETEMVLDNFAFFPEPMTFIKE